MIEETILLFAVIGVNLVILAKLRIPILQIVLGILSAVIAILPATSVVMLFPWLNIMLIVMGVAQLVSAGRGVRG